MGENRLTLSGEIVALDSLRYTPAGIPVVEMTLRHTSTQDEAGMKRQAECEVAVVAMAELANKARTLKAGDSVQVTGFLTRKSKNSDRLVLHLNQIET